MRSSSRRGFWLLGLLAAAAISTVIAVYPWKGNATRIGLSRPRELAPSELSRAPGPRTNVAVQKAGPPDPVAQETAATSAEKAAERAGALAASAQAK